MHRVSKSFIISLGLHILFLVVFYVIYLFSQERVINQKIVVELVSSVPKVKDNNSVKTSKEALQKRNIDSVLGMLKEDKILKMPEAKQQEKAPKNLQSNGKNTSSFNPVPFDSKDNIHSQKPKKQEQTPSENNKSPKDQIESKVANSNKNQDMLDKIKNIAPINENSLFSSSKEEKNKKLGGEKQIKTLEQERTSQHNDKKENDSTQISISSFPAKEVPNKDQLQNTILQEEKVDPKEKIEQQMAIENPLVQEKESPKIIDKQLKSLTINKSHDGFEDFLEAAEKKLTQKMENIEEISNLSESEKDLLRSKITKCWSGLISIREKDLILIVEIFMNSDATIENVKIKTEDNSISKKEIEALQQRVKEIFSNPQCIVLPLPKDRYEVWKQFSIKLNLKGFFQ